MPPLCQAISGSVGPRTKTWSMARTLNPVTIGFSTIFVESYSPPMPTSSTTAPTRSQRYVWNARRVKYLKYTGLALPPTASTPFSSAALPSRSQTCQKYFANSPFAIGLLSIWIRSRTLCRCGEVYSPTFCLPPGNRCRCSAIICDVNAQVDPLPLVPEMWMMFSSLRS